VESERTEIKNFRGLLPKIVEVLEKDDRIIFAYLYGSAIESHNPKDIDIAVYVREDTKLSIYPVDIKINLFEATGIAPDLFDVRIINDVVFKGDIFALLYLKDVLTKSILIVDKDPEKRASFLEHYGFKFRECEGLIAEILR